MLEGVQYADFELFVENIALSYRMVFFLEKGVVFGSPLTEEGIAQIYQLIEYLHKSKTTRIVVVLC